MHLGLCIRVWACPVQRDAFEAVHWSAVIDGWVQSSKDGCSHRIIGAVSKNGCSHRKMGTVIVGWLQSSKNGYSHRGMGAVMEGWEQPSRAGCWHRRMGAVIEGWQVESRDAYLYGGQCET